MLYKECKSGNILVKRESWDAMPRNLFDFSVLLYDKVDDCVNVSIPFSIGNDAMGSEFAAIVGKERICYYYEVHWDDAVRFREGKWVTIYQQGEIDQDFAESKEFRELGTGGSFDYLERKWREQSVKGA